MEREDWYEEAKEQLFEDKCNEMWNAYVDKFNLVKSMELINKIEDNPIPQSKIDNLRIMGEVNKKKITPREGEKMVNYNNALDEYNLSSPMVLDYIIL